MSLKQCDKCKQFLNEETAKTHECPDFIKNKPTPVDERDNDTKWTEDDEGATAELKAKRIVTLDDLIEACDIDLTKWYIERHVVNKWEVGAKDDAGQIQVEPLFQVKAWLKPLEEYGDIIAEIEDAKQLMMDARPKWERVAIVTRRGNVMVEVSMPDVHFGMLAWGEETLGKNWDTKLASEAYDDSMATLIDRSGGDVYEYVYVIGNDGVHTDQSVPGSNAGGATARGTVQDVDTRPRKVFSYKKHAVIRAINMMLERAPVRVVVVEGNHDRNVAFYLGEVIDAFFHDHPNVHVDNGPSQRKYCRFGDNLIGFTHGDNEKPDDLPLIMAQEVPDLWSQTRYREWRLGHLHKKRRGLTFDSEEYRGVRVRWMPSITPRDAWHASKGYMHQLSAETLLWHPTEGNVGSAIINLGVG